MGGLSPPRDPSIKNNNNAYINEEIHNDDRLPVTIIIKTLVNDYSIPHKWVLIIIVDNRSS